jgi:hypothetical protein
VVFGTNTILPSLTARPGGDAREGSSVENHSEDFLDIAALKAASGPTWVNCRDKAGLAVVSPEHLTVAGDFKILLASETWRRRLQHVRQASQHCYWIYEVTEKRQRQAVTGL